MKGQLAPQAKFRDNRFKRLTPPSASKQPSARINGECRKTALGEGNRIKSKIAKQPSKENGPAGGGSLAQRLRLGSGLVLIAFVVMHFLNHALGHISLAAMQEGQDLRYLVWHSAVGSLLLYSALSTHIALALWKTAKRGTLRMSGWEAVQLTLGLLIPIVLIKHIVATRGAEILHRTFVDHRHELSVLWPDNALLQSLLLVIVWTHGAIGLHYWLRLFSWYRPMQTLLLGAAVALPLLALTGWIAAARRLVQEAAKKSTQRQRRSQNSRQSPGSELIPSMAS